MFVQFVITVFRSDGGEHDGCRGAMVAILAVEELVALLLGRDLRQPQPFLERIDGAVELGLVGVLVSAARQVDRAAFFGFDDR